MLCAVCLSMFSDGAHEGTHHTCLKDLQRAAQGGCKICIGLVIRRDGLGPDPASEAMEMRVPFLYYRWMPSLGRTVLKDGSRMWAIRFYSEIRWLGEGVFPWNDIEIHTSLMTEAVPEWYLNLSERAASDLGSQPWNVRRDLFPLRPIPNSTGHERVFQVGKAWLDNCDRSHDCETFNNTLGHEWYPKRLIDVTDPASPRLLETQLEHPHSRYATLSHCWGADPDFITLTTENLADFRQGIAFDTLPRSFRDAIVICNHLAIEYIWIDSLCILQDSDSDWLLHAAEMSSVYLNCYLNLSFDCAANPRQGAFRSRNTDVLQDCYAFSTTPGDLKWPSTDDGGSPISDDDRFEGLSDGDSEMSRDDEKNGRESPDKTEPIDTDSTVAKGPLRCSVFVPWLDSCYDFFQGSARALPLSSRGWVVQERLLSPRVLHFTDDRIRWECGNFHYGLDEGVPHGLTETGEPYAQYAHEFNCFPERKRRQRHRDHFARWERIVRRYSACLLTYPEKDKLAAFAAVSQRFAAVFGDEYYAGHFRKNMPFDLAWRVIGRRHGEKPAIRRLPTWSWTSVDGQVTTAPPDFRDSLIVVEDVSVTLTDPSYRYGPVRDGQLKLKCLVMSCELGARQTPLDYRDGLFPDLDVRRVCLQGVVGYNSYSTQTDLSVDLDAPEKEILEDMYLIPLIGRKTAKGLQKRGGSYW